MMPVVTGKGGQEAEGAVVDIPGTDTAAGVVLQPANRGSWTVKGGLDSCLFIKCSCWRMQAGMVMNRWEQFRPLILVWTELV